MALIGLVGDLHFRASSPIERIDDYIQVQYDKARQAFSHFKELKVQAVIAPGDIFNNYGRDSYDVLYNVVDLLKEYGLPVYIVFGQHDIRFHNLEVKDTPLQILIKSHLVYPLGRKGTHIGNDVYLFGASYGEPLFPVPKKDKGKINILVLHHMIINGRKLWSGQTDHTQARVLERKYKYDLFVCGDNHQAFVNGKVINCGSITRMRIDQANHHPMYAVYSEHKLECYEYDIAPAHKVLMNWDAQQGNLKKLTKDQKLAFIESLGTDYEGEDYRENVKIILRGKRRVRKRTRQIIEESFNGNNGQS